MSAWFSPWFDRTAPLPRAWPPVSPLNLGEALRDIARHDRYGHALHLGAAVVFAALAPLDHAPNSVATIALYAIALARAIRFPALWTPLLRWTPLWLGLAWVGALLLALACAPGETAPRTLNALRYLLVPAALFPVVAGDPRGAGLLARTLVAAAAFNAAVQVFQRFGLLLPAQGASWRPSGLTALPAVAAINAGSAIIVALALSAGASIRARIALVAAIAACAVGMMLAASRQPVLALPLGIAVLLALLLATGRLRPRAAMGLLAPPAAVAAIGFLFFGRPMAGYFSTAVGDATAILRGEPVWSSLQVRLIWWRIGLDAFLAHPWTGCGPGSFRPLVEASPDLPRLIEETGISREEMVPLHPHSTYVRALAETGLAGAATLGALIASMLAAAWRTARRGPVEASGALAAITFVLLCSATECVELMNLAFSYLMVLIAIAALPRVSGTTTL